MFKPILLLMLSLGLVLFALTTEAAAFSGDMISFQGARIEQGVSADYFKERDRASSGFINDLNLRRNYYRENYYGNIDKAQYFLREVKKDIERKNYLWRKRVAGFLVNFEEEEEGEEELEDWWIVREEEEQEGSEKEEEREEDEG